MWQGLSFVCQAQRCSLVDSNEDLVRATPEPGYERASFCPAMAGLCRSCEPPIPRTSVAVMRHGERLDASDPAAWFQSAAAQDFPFDCPLSAKGKRQVAGVARELARRSSNRFSCVVSSPFLRCLETAVEVCRALHLPICVDLQLGEVFGPACFGDWSPPGPVRRSREEVLALLPPDVRSLSPVDFFGEEPQWPESIENARLRMVSRVEQYAEWSSRLEGGANFFLVTHGDCVGACLTLALAAEEGGLQQVVEKVDYCGYALLERAWEPGEAEACGLLDQGARWRVQHGHVSIKSAAQLQWQEERLTQEEEDALLAGLLEEAGEALLGQDAWEPEEIFREPPSRLVSPGLLCI